MELELLKYPIGKYIEQPFSNDQLKERLLDIQFMPQQIEHAITNLDEAQLASPYREGGWAVKQLVHHVADSHMNAYIRFKLGLSETNPVIKPYEQKEWAEMIDSKNIPINVSITLLYALHIRWYEILKNISDVEWNRTLYHPIQQKEMSLWFLLGLYAWHCRHHVSQVTNLRTRMGW